MGTAKDTGKPGPTWTITAKDGSTSYCTGPAGPCEHHPLGPVTVKAYKGGLYKACSEAGACGQVDVDRGL